MGIFKSKLTATEIEGKIKAFDEDTDALKSKLFQIGAELESAYVATAEAEITGEAGLSKAELKKLRNQKNDLADELKGREKVRAKLEAELETQRRREELHELKNKKSEGLEQAEKFGKSVDRLLDLFSQMNEEIKTLSEIERQIPRDGFGQGRSTPYILNLISRGIALVDNSNFDDAVKKIEGQKMLTKANVDEWFEKQQSRVNSRFSEEAAR